ncbi:MAG TPA: 1-acyl-sn-glycerol-3-phosphate acyltransferase [Longimicrobium sp.]|nr:1-acyl-sn-glycerol-3-phosphate acyltransferase [Longimicrobium sp.]
MRETRFSPVALRLFELFLRRWERRSLEAVRVTGLPRDLPPNVPLVLAANHVSMWDAFTLRHVQRLLRPDAPLYTLSSERELERFGFFRRLGAYGVDPADAGSVLRAVRFTAARAEAQRDAVFSFFPQGRIWPSHRRPLGFQRGIELFTRRMRAGLVLPLAIHHEPLNHARPTVFVSAGPVLAMGSRGIGAAEVERAVSAESDRLLAFVARWGEEAPQAWPAPFGRLDRPRVRGVQVAR